MRKYRNTSRVKPKPAPSIKSSSHVAPEASGSAKGYCHETYSFRLTDLVRRGTDAIPFSEDGPGKSARSHTADEFIFVKEIEESDRDVSGAAGRSKNLNYHYLFSHGSGFSFFSFPQLEV